MKFSFPLSLTSKYKGIFVTGTDTGVGKTFIAGLIVRGLNKKGIAVGVMKPVSSGGREDALLLKKIAGIDDPIDDINPVYFEKSIAPLIASRIEKKYINLDNVLQSYKKLCRKYNFLIVEGAGGLKAPITKDIYIADLAKRFGLPLIIVSHPGIGAINHTLLTIDCARMYGLKILGFVMNYNKNHKKGLAEKTNPRVISRLGRIKFLGNVSYKANGQ